ncbi:aminopeptidase P family protein [Halogeometricum borinquense]|uniref:Aminopeptidase P family protein n=1 Tax=Halogeometricum borinquense TaxID=60847 RepID=A0A6C0UCR1_9EURY|nr:Xaa-Pro peptidase family protein [Halogeometricum borinquense]QIB73104.1 aminopeptidase P family protein [Halogeometricum borinquense]QIQ77498.1 aminopeptidase P family protein [Halogeometricum borinquense]
MPDPHGSLPAPETDPAFLDSALAAADAVGFVAVGNRFDDGLRYLTRFSGPDRNYAFVYADGEAILCAPALFTEQAEREFAGTVRTTDVGDPTGIRAANTLSDLGASSGTVLVPQSIPHDAAVHLEQAGYDLESTTAVADARVIKTESEIDCLRRVQRAAVRGMRRAEEILAAAEPMDDELIWQDSPLSTERLRRQVNAELAVYGVRDAGNTVIGAGPTCADLHYTGMDVLRPDETILLDISPRGPHGYYGDLSRTYVVDSNGGWERRAYVAVEAALKAGLAEIEPGAHANNIHREAAAELTAHGFDPNADEGEAGFTHGTGHGVGISLHEGPSLREPVELESGMVFTVEPGVYDPEQGGVRLEELVVVTDDGYETLHEYPRSFTPRAE